MSARRKKCPICGSKPSFFGGKVDIDDPNLWLELPDVIKCEECGLEHIGNGHESLQELIKGWNEVVDWLRAWKCPDCGSGTVFMGDDDFPVCECGREILDEENDE